MFGLLEEEKTRPMFLSNNPYLNIPVRTGLLNDREPSSTLRETSPIFGGRHDLINKDSGSLPNSSSTGVLVREGPKYYCLRSISTVQQADCLNTNVLDCSVTFSVDKNICVVGVQVPTQIAAVS